MEHNFVIPAKYSHLSAREAIFQELTRRLKEKTITQAKVSEKSGISPPAVSKFVTGGEAGGTVLESIGSCLFETRRPPAPPEYGNYTYEAMQDILGLYQVFRRHSKNPTSIKSSSAFLYWSTLYRCVVAAIYNDASPNDALQIYSMIERLHFNKALSKYSLLTQYNGATRLTLLERLTPPVPETFVGATLSTSFWKGKNIILPAVVAFQKVETLEDVVSKPEIYRTKLVFEITVSDESNFENAELLLSKAEAVTKWN